MRFLAVFAWVLFAANVAAAACSSEQVNLRGAWGQVGFSVEIADTDESRAQGLMFRESMPRFSGMLFIYPNPRHAQFWMKNTYIPLDMLFIDEAGVIQTIHPMATPGSLTTVNGGEGVLAVLEINGGLAQTLGITVGSEVQHPAFKENAIWACD